MAHFDCKDEIGSEVWAVSLVATPSSSHDAIPKLDSYYWDGASSVPSAKLARLGVDLNWRRNFDGPNLPDPELAVSSQSTMKITAILDIGEDATSVYRGTWFGVRIVSKKIDNMDSYYKHDVAYQFLCEVHAYLRLCHLRGTVVPEFFGLYRSDSFALLVLEDAGEPFFDDLDGCGEIVSDEWAVLDVQERCVF
jgi:hypothetical protein